MANTDENATERKQTVLVVDGEILIRLAICDYLRDCGYRVIEAVSAEEALTILNHPELAVDVVLSDVEQGGPMDGFGLAQWARANKPGVTVVLAASATRAAGSRPVRGKPAALPALRPASPARPYQTVHRRPRFGQPRRRGGRQGRDDVTARCMNAGIAGLPPLARALDRAYP